MTPVPRPLACFLAFLFTAGWLVLVLPANMQGGPVMYAGDEIYFSAMARTATEGNAEYLHPRLAAPARGDWRDLPIAMPLEYSAVRFLSRLGLDSHQALAWVWILAVGVTAATGCLAFTEVGLSPPLAAVLGVLFALQPYIWRRQLIHFNMVFPLIAFPAAASLRLAAGGWPERPPRWLSLGCFLQGISFVYYSHYAFMLLMVGAGAGWLRGGRRVLKQAAACLLPLLLGVAIYAMPILSYRAEQGYMSLQRSPAETEVAALKLRHLLSPRTEHPLGPWRKVEVRLHGTNFPPDNGESEGSRLGTFGSLGLVLGLGLVAASCCGVRPRWAEPVALPASLMALSVLVIGLTGGAASVINAFSVADVRVYARLVVYLEFYVFAVAGCALAAAWPRRAEVWFPLALVLLVLGGACDETWLQRPLAGSRREFAADGEFVSALEAELPPGSAVFQIPVTRFYGDWPPVGRMVYYDGGKPYLNSHHLRWSWGALTGRQDAWARWAEALSPEQLVRAVKAQKFRALWIDTYGYSDRPADLVRLQEVLGQPTWSSPTCRYLVYDLERARVAPVSTPALTAGEIARIELSAEELPPGWSGPQQVKIRLLNRTERTLASNPPQPVHLCYHWADSQGRPVVWDGRRTPLPPVAPGGELNTWMTVDPPPAPGPFTLQLRLVQEGVRWQDGGPDERVGAR